MNRFLRIGMPAFALATGAFALPASASLEFTSNYSALSHDDVALAEYAGAVSCVPPGAHYVPSFIRTLDGTIIGVGYVEVESAASGC
ncbi:hypothetical protein ASC97_00410 [Rhizobium sp. Root1203]|jgi:hypothetical protein|uniref:hypothetical protein n=1 Tax=Rhizobium sp. Root1203 TaxID=1736427 RepID=UPI00070CEC09|nr:hypothetical protein [Rhizobium sp. Root1203]KQV32102.1 hypothetical protein ASC97_00410 [Rhizobium sp. Root1203]